MMNKSLLVAFVAVFVAAGASYGQQAGCSNCGSTGGVVSDGATHAFTGDVAPQEVGCFKKGRPHPGMRSTIYHALRDRRHPIPLYAYGRAGVEATRQHAWNMSQMQGTSWNGNYSSWRHYGPTAVVVPPTAAFQTNYAWGVGQTTSTPIHHMFQHQYQGGGYGGGGGAGAGHWRNTPYWPSHTGQFGYYSVRAPW